MPRKLRIDMTGFRQGRLMGLEYSHSHGGHAYWLFACDCGNETVAKGASVRMGRTSSCGCLHKEISAERLITHGRRIAKRHDATYRAWQEINNACTDRQSPRYRDHGALGIRVCSAWKADFMTFLADMGERPSGTKLSRLDPDSDFSRSNCRWTTLAPRAHRAVMGWERFREAARA
jgi:hypothetical protein